MLNRLVKIRCDISKDYVPRKTRYLSGQPTGKKKSHAKEMQEHEAAYVILSDAKRLKLGNEATNIEKRLQRSYDNDRSENEIKTLSTLRSTCGFH